MAISVNPGPNRAMRRMQRMTRHHITKAFSRGTKASGNWRGGCFGQPCWRRIEETLQDVVNESTLTTSEISAS